MAQSLTEQKPTKDCRTVIFFDQGFTIVQLEGEQTCCQYRRTEDGGLQLRDMCADYLTWNRVPGYLLMWMRLRRTRYQPILGPLGL